ncbi:MAG: hypothetical protein JJ863_37140 [Deltaproteobacteria bacterium]|nr:hypothetical protein [Deltaproteobacteria bacterium]
MARQIVVQLGESPSTFDFKKVDRAKLYGSRKRMPLDPTGERCTRASLTEDGALLIQSGMTAQGYFTEDGYWVPNKELIGLDDEGEPVEKRASTLGQPQALEGPLGAEALLDTKVHAVYALDASEVDEALLAKLAEGALYRFPFSYRGDYSEDVAFLVQNGDGDVFALVGRTLEPEWRDPEERIPTFTEDEDDDDDELDFEMF